MVSRRYTPVALLLAIMAIGCAESRPAAEEVAAPPAAETASTPKTPAVVATDEAAPAVKEAVAKDEGAKDDMPPEDAAKTDPPKDETPAEAAAETAATAGMKLIPRLVLFGNPDKASARLSHDGTKLSYLAPNDGVMNVFVGPVDDPAAAKPVTNDKQRGIRSYFWAYDNKHILYIQDSKGDEDWHVYSVDLESGETKDLTPTEKAWPPRSKASARSFPARSSSALNDRDPQFHDLYRDQHRDGRHASCWKRTPSSPAIVIDDDFKVRFASKMMPDGSIQYFRAQRRRGLEGYINVGADDTLTTAIAGFDKTGKKLYLTDSRDRNTTALVEIDLDGGQQKVLGLQRQGRLRAA